jgi:pyridoxal biosynthesis lyase PdxS
MDVINAEQVCDLFLDPMCNRFLIYNTLPIQARIAEEAGACAVMALERVPADIRREGGVARMVRPHLHLTTYYD